MELDPEDNQDEGVRDDALSVATVLVGGEGGACSSEEDEPADVGMAVAVHPDAVVAGNVVDVVATKAEEEEEEAAAKTPPSPEPKRPSVASLSRMAHQRRIDKALKLLVPDIVTRCHDVAADDGRSWNMRLPMNTIITRETLENAIHKLDPYINVGVYQLNSVLPCKPIVINGQTLDAGNRGKLKIGTITVTLWWRAFGFDLDDE